MPLSAIFAPSRSARRASLYYSPENIRPDTRRHSQTAVAPVGTQIQVAPNDSCYTQRFMPPYVHLVPGNPIIVQEEYASHKRPTYAGNAVYEQSSTPQAYTVSEMSFRGEWRIHVYAQNFCIPSSMLSYFERSKLKDVLLNSLSPLTQQCSRSETSHIEKQAAIFFSSFEPKALWDVNVENLPEELGRILLGVTPNSRNMDIGFRFMRFRFPHIWFEVSVLRTPELMPVDTQSEEPDQVKVVSLWKAWARDGPSSGLAAYGTMTDYMRMYSMRSSKPVYKISSRTFKVIQVYQPELLTPTPYPANIPECSNPSDILVFSTSWSVIRFLRKTERVMTFLMALSALLAALHPIVSNFNAVVGWILAAIGVVSGFVSVLAVLTSWALGWIEANAAMQRQHREN